MGEMLKQVFNEAADADKTGGVALGYVEDLVQPRTKLRACFSISNQWPHLRRNAAPTNPVNNGCGWCGRELYSG